MTVDHARLKKVREDLEAITLKINPLILRAEAAFSRLGPKFPAAVLLERVPPRRGKRGPHYLHRLWLRRHGTSWRMFVESCPEDISRAPTFSPLETSSRRLRLLALEALPELEVALFPSSAKRTSASPVSTTPRRS